ncbi:serine/threonine-protein kinase [Nocardia inohanensis]|uniref:serine/threonine-protein kinase n=1 Tax=Nocardia inohanensis TaxID=209246 RepID=UPI000831C22D|nr:serine/threonine-protein kinase [Nocardia inohanensis]
MRTPLPEPGDVFAGYRIERILGRGGMGAVYLAAHPRLPRYDALKVMTSPGGDAEFSGAPGEFDRADAEQAARFRREAELVALLDHPNIVPVFDRGSESGLPWLAMGFVDGIDAAELIRRWPEGVPPDQATHVVTEAARGLDEAHRAGVLHRDVKPANILLEPRPGRADRVYVTDFGIARPVADTARLTAAGTVVATLAYAAPELLTGQAIDQRADVYALGCTLFELLTGTKPFPHATPAALVRAHLSDPPPRPSALRPALPPALDEVVRCALAKDPEERYASCGALASAAEQAAFGGPGSPGGAPAPRTRTGSGNREGRTGGRRLGWAAAGLVAAVAAVTAAVAVWPLSPGAGPATPETAATTPAVVVPSTAASGRLGWGAYQFVIDALPALLPSAPTGIGFQGLRCSAYSQAGERIEISVPLGSEARLRCRGDGNPVEWLFVDCAVDRSAMALEMSKGSTAWGERAWERSSGTGRQAWGAGVGQFDRSTGTLVITFDDDARKFCSLTVFGGTVGGQSLIEKWWTPAPL